MFDGIPILLLASGEPKQAKSEIGKSFEQLMRSILDRMGYGDIRANIHKTGAEIDIKATHKVTGLPFMAECKGHADPVRTNDVKKAYGQFKKEQAKAQSLVGIFVSLNGFDPTCAEWYRELSDAEKTVFLLKDGPAVLQLLVESALLVPDDTARFRVKSIAQEAAPAPHLAVLNGQLYWVLLLVDTTGESLYTVFDDHANIVPRPVARLRR